MAIKFELVKAGDVLWDRHREKMGNTTRRRVGEWPVKVLEIDHTAGTAKVSWNGNPARSWGRRSVERLYRSRMRERHVHLGGMNNG